MWRRFSVMQLRSSFQTCQRTAMGRYFGRFSGGLVVLLIFIYHGRRGEMAGDLVSCVFLTFNNVASMELKLNQIRIGGFKISANLARFSKSTKDKVEGANVIKPQNPNSGTIPGVSFADILKRPTERKSNGISTGGSTHQEQVVEIDARIADTGWIQGSFTGGLKSFDLVNNISRVLAKAGIGDCLVRSFGGLLVLLTATGKRSMEAIVDANRSLFSDWFSFLRPWAKLDVGDGRLVWLRCFGIPLHLWNEEFFDQLASRWGNYLGVDEATRRRTNLNFGRLAVFSAHTKLGRSALRLKVEEEVFQILVEEEDSVPGWCGDLLQQVRSEGAEYSSSQADAISVVPVSVEEVPAGDKLPVGAGGLVKVGDSSSSPLGNPVLDSECADGAANIDGCMIGKADFHSFGSKLGLDDGDKGNRVSFFGFGGRRETALPCLLQSSAFRSVPLPRSSFYAEGTGLEAQARALMGPRAVDLGGSSCGKLTEAHYVEVRPTSPFSCPGVEAHVQAPYVNHSDDENGPTGGDCLEAQKSGGSSSNLVIIRRLALTCSGQQKRTRGKNRTMEELLQLRLSKRTLRQKGKKKKSGAQRLGHAQAQDEVAQSCSVESVRDSQFENRNKILRDGKEPLANKVQQISPEESSQISTETPFPAAVSKLSDTLSTSSIQKQVGP
ncbi:hypothetical protein Ancab_035856 [Ancistrocladus abbreviatus]